MPNNNYQRGATFERKVCDMLRSFGYSAARTAGSHGVYDIIAVDTSRVLMIQCKTGKHSKFTNEDRNELVSHAMAHGAHPILATKDETGHIKLEYLSGLLKPGQRRRPKDDVDLLFKGGWGDIRPNGAEPPELPGVYQEGRAIALGR